MHPWAVARFRPWPGLFLCLAFLIGSALTRVRSEVDAPSKGGQVNTALAQRALGLLHDQCLSCHNADKKKGGLVMQTRDALLAGGDEGTVVVAGDADASPLLKALQPDSDPHMPPQKQLSTNQIDLLRHWIADGVAWDDKAIRGEHPKREVKLESIPAGYAPVLALALAPDNRWLAIGRGPRIVVHDMLATNFPVVADFEAHRDVVRALAWSPDGRKLASGAFRELTVWDTNGFKARWTMHTGMGGRVTALRFSPYGGVLAAADSMAGESAWVRLFQADLGTAMAAWPAHTDSIYDLAMSTDGGVLATASGDKLVKLWELISQREIGQLEGHSGAVTGLAFNAEGTALVSVSADKQLKIWNSKTYESTLTLSGRKRGFTSAAWSADGKVIIAADEDGHLSSFTNFKSHTGEQSSAAADERELGHWPEPLHTVAVSADGKRVYAGGQDGLVYVTSDDAKLLTVLRESPQSAPTIESSSAQVRAIETNSVPPSFVYDVLPLLSKAGCSAGSCHAKPEGQNGFKLSVFNYDPKSDYAEIVKEGRGRRIFPAAPPESLVLLKPTLAVEHGGGQRFEPGSTTYRTLVNWIRGGMVYQNTNEPTLVRVVVEPRERSYLKGASQHLRVTAHYSNGSVRDVTALAHFAANDKEIATVDDDGNLKIGQISGESAIVARFMGLVDASRITVPADRLLPEERYAHLPRSNFIDDLAWAHFQKLGLFPSDLCTDAEFLRRSCLDTLGLLPTPEEARSFLSGSDPDKRVKWIDALLSRSGYADYWANKWADLLRPNPDRVGVKSVFILDQWLRDSFRSNKPYDQFAREILVAEGNNHRDGSIVIYRDRREPSELTTLFSQLFLGVRMECARCHHHPNEKWSLDDFYQLAAFFGPVKQRGAGLSPPISAGNETFYYAPGGAVKHPLTDAPMIPHPLDGPPVADATTDPRRILADWLTHPNNPFFARAAVNRIWAAFFGRGFVEPVDDFRISNPVVNEPLLDALARDFVENHFDLKHLMRTILQSRLYQLSSTPNESNLADTKNFSRSLRRRLPAEVLLDAVADVTDVPEEFNGLPPGARAMQTWSYKIPSHFLDAFGRPNSSSDCPCERDLRPSVVQSLHMMNSKALQAKLENKEGRAVRLAESTRAPSEIALQLYYTVFSRPPTAAESEAAVKAFDAPGATRQTATEDLLWALLNSAEFVFNH